MTKLGLGDADWSEIKAEMRHILIGLARKRQTICYSDLAVQIRTAYIHHRAPAFMAILRELVDEDSAEGHPTLAALVVRKQTGRCGPGFFRIAAENGEDISDPEAFWKVSFERVCDFWSEI